MRDLSLEAREAQRVTRGLLSCLSEDLLKPKYKRKRTSRTYGHCYVMSEALYHLWGKHNGFRPHQMNVNGESHWFLKHEDGVVWDPTSSQFLPLTLDYSKGKHRAFMTKEPSKRAKELLRRYGSRFE